MPDPVLDTSDLDNYLGKVMQPARMTEAISNNDIRRWAQAMHYPNRIHYDNAWAAESRFGKLVAPQSFAVTMDDGHGSAPSCIGSIPNSHMLFGGDEGWFYGPRMKGGDRIWNERIPFDYTVKETKFGGPTCFQRGDNFYYNQDGDLICKQRSTSIRYNQATGQGNTPEGADDPEWSDDELEALEVRKFQWIKMLHDLGHNPRYWDSVVVGEALPERVFGPHSIVSFATEWRAYPMTTWGATAKGPTTVRAEELGYTKEMAGFEGDRRMERVNPELTDGAYYGPSRGHLQPRWAQHVGMPRGYGYGASMGAWIIDFVAAWAGEWGSVVHSSAQYRNPAFTGDATFFTGEVVDTRIERKRKHIAVVKVELTNQDDAVMAKATVEVELPSESA